MMTRVSQQFRILLVLGTVPIITGCGYIADKDNIRIAKFMDGYITRGDLDDVIRNMDSDERPEIRTRGDLLMTLEAHIDQRMKSEIADVLEAEAKIHVPREIAAQIYTAKHPDKVIDPQAMKDMGLSDSDIKILEQEREMGIDKETRLLLAEEAVRYRIQEAFQAGALNASDEEIQREYDLRKAELMNPERVTFQGVYFPVTIENCASLAAEARKRLQSGAPVEQVLTYAKESGGDQIEATLQNDGRNVKFASFWESASGSQPGFIVGPIFMPGWERIQRNAQNQAVREILPDAYLVAVVREQIPETQKTLEQAKDELLGYLLYNKMINRLREEFSVEVYPEKLPDPSMYDTEDYMPKQTKHQA
ncbi:MAG: hypothetical protein AMXMBFR84_05430 [Candidatus Hydrogenedentota bacterium]